MSSSTSASDTKAKAADIAARVEEPVHEAHQLLQGQMPNNPDKALGHPIHPATVHWPIAFLTTTFSASGLTLLPVQYYPSALLPAQAVMPAIAHWSAAAAVITAIPAIVTGIGEGYELIRAQYLEKGSAAALWDASWNMKDDGGRKVKMTVKHASMNDAVVGLAAYTWYHGWKYPGTPLPKTAKVLGLVAVPALLYSAMLGGRLVYEYAVGVQRQGTGKSVVGQLVYHLSGRKVLKYPEEKAGFIVPQRYRTDKTPESSSASTRGATSGVPSRPQRLEGQDGGGGDDDRVDGVLAVASSGDPEELGDDKEKVIVVGWYGDDDPENPQNWSLLKKSWLVFCIMLITTAVYIGSSIYSPAIGVAAEYFGVSEVVSILGLSLFVVGYGIGPLFLAPITEIPQIGRNLPYIVPLAIFCVLQVPTALVDNFAGFCILRFIAGFVSSPPLATGGASLFDIFSQKKITYSMGLYDLACAAGPTLGPIVAGFAVEANGWRWAFWEMLWITGFALALLSFTMPETSPENILYRRADRLRRLTGNKQIRSEAELDSHSLHLGSLILEAIYRPIQMTFREPIIIAVNLFIGFVYALLYSYFESFPIVYGPDGYDFPGGVQYLPFAALIAGEFFSFVGYSAWAWFYYEKKFDESGGVIQPEVALPMGIPGAIITPVTLFWLAWSANRTHWIVPVLSHLSFGLATTWLFMPFLTYLPLAYPRYAASSLASNDFVRSMLGAGMPLASYPLFHNLGIDWGNTLLGFVSLLLIPIPWLLFRYGDRLRNMSPMALHDDQLEELRRAKADKKKSPELLRQLSSMGSPSRCPRRLSGVSQP